jgi:cysteine desulfurase
LDNAATTPVRPEVLEAMLPHFHDNGYNPSSLHAEGRAARAALEDARRRVAACLGCARKEIVFTAGGSESDNLALLGTARSLAHRGRHIVTTAIEHHAVLHAAQALREDGFDVTFLPVDESGMLDPQQFAAAIRSDTIVASVMYANNEIGTIAPIARLCEIAHEAGALFHTDAVAAATYLPLDVDALGVDMLSIAAHKFYGPKGVGALYVRQGTPLGPIIHGGSQEFAKRAGTENVPGIVGMALALELAMGERTQAAGRIGSLRDDFEEHLVQRISGVRVNGAGAPRAPHISSVSLLGIESEALLMRLDLDGVAASAGSACASGVIEPSHVIAALGLSREWTQGVIRLSLGRSTTPSQVSAALQVLEQAAADLRSFSPVPA